MAPGTTAELPTATSVAPDTSAMPPAAKATAPGTTVEPQAADPCILLTVKDQQGSEVTFKIRRLTPLMKLMDPYRSRLGWLASQASFLVDGACIAPDDTAEKLGLVDGDVIDVVQPPP